MLNLLQRAVMRWVGILYRLHVNLYAVSAINRKSFNALCCIGGHWQMKTGIYNLRNSVLPPSETTIFYCLFTFLSDTNCHKLPKNSRSSLNTKHYTLHSKPSSINHQPQLRCLVVVFVQHRLSHRHRQRFVAIYDCL